MLIVHNHNLMTDGSYFEDQLIQCQVVLQNKGSSCVSNSQVAILSCRFIPIPVILENKKMVNVLLLINLFKIYFLIGPQIYLYLISNNKYGKQKFVS